MAEQIGESSPAAAFDYELYEGDPDHLRTVVATPPQISPWIDHASLKLKHRIGRGPFGDVWLATHHQSADDFDEYHEVAVKMLHPIKEDHMQKFLNKFEELFPKLRRHSGVCWLHGISVISGKICLAMKFHKGSVGDRMARLKGGKLPLPDVLRHGIDLAKGIQELHSIGVLVLNLKPSNFLLNEHDHVVLGDFGIPYLLLGIPLPDSDLVLRLGTPNYMAPEQWEPEVRGPVTFETDTWGFGCSIVEMLTGVQPWFGMSTEDIYQSVVIKQEKPQLPNGLPPAIENIVNGCFEYDLRNRPLMADIIHGFESSQNGVNNDGEWIGLGSRIVVDKSNSSGYSSWFLLKEHLQVGDTIRSRKVANSCKQKCMDVPEGTVVGLEEDTDRNEFVLVRVHGIQHPKRINTSTLERVTSGLAAGDWVRLIEENNHHSSVGILHHIQRDGAVAVGFLGLETLWRGHCSQLQVAEIYYVGQFVRLKECIFTPRFEWPRKRGGGWATGRISQILSNGCLVVGFPGRFVFGDESRNFLADPSQVELVSFDSCPGIVEKYEHMEDFHWAVRPLAIALGLFTALKLGLFVRRKAGGRLKKGGQKNQKQGEGYSQDGQSGGGNSAWLPSPVANILFREGGSPTATAR
ncbi:Protein KINASE OF THE OUTER CHLOROPLAST MEMBRANE 1 [Sarracenia purpurea var. burkii]